MSQTTSIHSQSTEMMTAAEQPPCCMDGMDKPAATAEHAWLERFVGTWDAQVEAFMEEGKPGFVTKGEEHTTKVGDLWILAEGKNTVFPYSYRFTLGYDADRKRYVGTWIDTMFAHLWVYEGTVDTSGRILTLETEGPNPMEQGKRTRYREVTEFVSDDRRVFTSSRLTSEGRWVLCMRVTADRRR